MDILHLLGSKHDIVDLPKYESWFKHVCCWQKIAFVRTCYKQQKDTVFHFEIPLLKHSSIFNYCSAVWCKKKKSQLQQLLCQTPESCVSCGTKRGHKKLPPSKNNHKYFFLDFGMTKFVWKDKAISTSLYHISKKIKIKNPTIEMVLFWIAVFLHLDAVKWLRICQDFHYSL